MRFKFPISVANPLTILRQWAAEARVPELVTQGELKWVPWNPRRCTIGGTIAHTSIVTQNVNVAEYFPLGELVLCRAKIALEVALTAGTYTDRIDYIILNGPYNRLVCNPSTITSASPIAGYFEECIGTARFAVLDSLGASASMMGTIGDEGVPSDPNDEFRVRTYDSVGVPIYTKTNPEGDMTCQIVIKANWFYHKDM